MRHTSAHLERRGWVKVADVAPSAETHKGAALAPPSVTRGGLRSLLIRSCFDRVVVKSQWVTLSGVAPATA
jgi:hypothetical protein